MDGSSTPGLIQDSRIFQSWALYYSKFLSAYKAQGIPFWGLTIQNEPEFAAPWEACVYSPEVYTTNLLLLSHLVFRIKEIF
jgi:glucosylceramidase